MPGITAYLEDFDMTVHYPGPYEVRIPYTTDGLPHEWKGNCIVAGAAPDPGADPDDITMVTRGGSADLQTAVDGFWAVYRNLFAAATLAGTFELWRYPTPGGNAVFVTSGNLTTPNGVAGTYQPAQQVTLTFRTALGHIMRIVAIESSVVGNTREPLPTVGTGGPQTTAAYVLSANGWLIGRDDAFPIAPLNMSFGQNEAVFEKRFRR